jgi:hypothetical protein
MQCEDQRKQAIEGWKRSERWMASQLQRSIHTMRMVPYQSHEFKYMLLWCPYTQKAEHGGVEEIGVMDSRANSRRQSMSQLRSQINLMRSNIHFNDVPTPEGGARRVSQRCACLTNWVVLEGCLSQIKSNLQYIEHTFRSKQIDESN